MEINLLKKKKKDHPVSDFTFNFDTPVPSNHRFLIFFSASLASCFRSLRSFFNCRRSSGLYSGVFMYSDLGRAVQPWPSSM